MRQLEVFNNDIPVGLLTEVDKRHYEFQYYDDYLNSLLPAISFNLPKRKEKYTSQYLFPLFYNNQLTPFEEIPDVIPPD